MRNPISTTLLVVGALVLASGIAACEAPSPVHPSFGLAPTGVEALMLAVEPDDASPEYTLLAVTPTPSPIVVLPYPRPSTTLVSKTRVDADMVRIRDSAILAFRAGQANVLKVFKNLSPQATAQYNSDMDYTVASYTANVDFTRTVVSRANFNDLKGMVLGLRQTAAILLGYRAKAVAEINEHTREASFALHNGL